MTVRPMRGLARVLVTALGLAAMVAACSERPVTPQRPAPEGRLAVMGGSGLDLSAPPRDWVIQGGDANPRGQLRTVTLGGVPAVELRSGSEPIIAVRQVDAMMLATPFLQWSWNLSDHGEGIHPMRIVVGFSGGAPQDDEADGVLGGIFGDLFDTPARGGGLPAHDRALALVWGDSMLARGKLTLPPADQPLSAPLYTVRGGRENTRQWWVDAVDLSRFYRQAWPDDDMRNVRITFIGIAAAPRQPAVRGRVGGIMLTH